MPRLLAYPVVFLLGFFMGTGGWFINLIAALGEAVGTH